MKTKVLKTNEEKEELDFDQGRLQGNNKSFFHNVESRFCFRVIPGSKIKRTV
jgi:hypothetical protein